MVVLYVLGLSTVYAVLGRAYLPTLPDGVTLSEITGIDPSEGFIADARRNARTARTRFEVGDAQFEGGDAQREVLWRFRHCRRRDDGLGGAHRVARLIA